MGLTKEDRLEGRNWPLEIYLREIPASLFLLDKEGAIFLITFSAEKTLGIRRETILGKRWREIDLLKGMNDQIDRQNRSVLQTGIGKRGEVQFSGILGERWFEYHISPVRGDDNIVDGTIVTIVDITERKQRDELNDALDRVHKEISSTLDFDEIMGRVVVQAALAMGSEGSGVAFMEGDEWVLRYAHGLPSKVIGDRFPNMMLSVLPEPWPDDVVVIPDAYEVKRFDHELIKRYHIRGVLIVPLRIRNDLIGALGFVYFSDPHMFTVPQIDFAKKMASSLTLAIENSRSFERQQNERDRLRTILETLPVGVGIIDREGMLVMINDMMSKVWRGFVTTPHRISDLSMYKGWWVDTGIELKAGDWGGDRALAKGETSLGEMIDIQRLDGTRGTIMLSSAPIKDGAGNVTGAVVVSQDVTERVRIERELEESKNRAELYLDLLTHDVINYNAGAMGFLQLAEEKLKLDEKDMKLITRPLDELRNSSELIANIRDVNRVESGMERSEVIELGSLLKEVKEDYENPPEREVTINVSGEGEYFILASHFVRDVFSNIISNAIKHSKGPLLINIMLSRVIDDGRSFVRVSIEDNGPGIPHDIRENLFSRRSRGLTKAVGRGLGLYLVKRLVEDYNGEVLVQDRVPGVHSKGTIFIVLLPSASDD